MSQLPLGQRFTPKELDELFTVVDDQPYGNPAFAYQLMIPNSWQADRIEAEHPHLDTLALKPLAIFFGEPQAGSPPYVQLQAVRLVKEITAANWLRHFAITTERTLEALNELSPKFADSLVRFQIAHLPFKGRAAARIDGDRLFLLFAFASEPAYDALAETFGVAVTSWQLVHPSNATSIEPLVETTGPARLRFHYPQSWRTLVPEQLPTGKEVVDLYNFDDDQHLNGLIRIKAVSKELGGGLNGLHRSLLEEFQEANLTIQNLYYQAELPIANPRFSRGQYVIYEAVIEESGIAQELWISVFEDAAHYFAVALLTPDKGHIFYVWAINQRAYQLILASLQ